MNVMIQLGMLKFFDIVEDVMHYQKLTGLLNYFFRMDSARWLELYEIMVFLWRYLSS